MIYCKPVDIPGWEEAAEYMMKYLKDEKKVLRKGQFWNYLDNYSDAANKIRQILSPLNFNVFRISCLIINDQIAVTCKELVHVDYWGVNFPVPEARINIPLTKSCEQSITYFYECTGEPHKQTLDSGVGYYVWTQDRCKVVSSYVLDRPMIIRPGQPHSIDATKCTEPRICLSIVTDPDCAVLLN